MTVKVGFSVEFTHDALSNFGSMRPDDERQLRELYLGLLWGPAQGAFAARFGQGWPTQSAPADGHLGGVEARRIAVEVVQAFNLLGTGTTLEEPEEEPHCVTWVWIDGELWVEYNYLTDVASCANGSPPPGGTYHVAIRSAVP